MLCSTDPLTFLCNVEVSVILPNCQHEIKKPCYQSVEESKCSYPCESRLPCGHQCRLNCHVTDDPEHIKYQCHKACPKNNRDCVNNHPCKKRCFEECEPCFTRVIKKRFCGHIIKNIECSTDAKEKLCMMPCKLKLECGHPCRLKCSIQCGNCQERVKKSSDCGHEIYVRCCDQATASRCYNKCPKKLPCGHPCTTKCKDPCTINCKEKVKLNSPGLCGHTFSVPCYLKETDPKSSQLLQYCNEPCTEQLSCSHQCKGSCSKCKQGRFHAPCGQPCNNLLICGHPCTIPCRSECQPCNKPCELQCSHSKCRRKCGIPCIPCIEPCEWRCKHRRCTKRCSELCNIEPCNEPCKKLLKCKHPCVGFCGDPCPPLCRICDKEELIEFILLGIEEEPDARFIYLEDCKHCIESDGLMKWVMEQKDTTDQAVGIKTCPKCKTPIRKCMRLMNHLKRTFVDIQYIKRKNFGDHNQLKNQQSQYVETLKGYMTNQILLKEIPQLKNLLQNLLDQAIPINKQKRQILCAQEILAFEMILKLLKEIFNSLSLVNYKINNTVNSHKLVKNQIIMLVENFPLKWQISNQEINDINLELGRLKYIISFHQTDIDGINNGLANEAQKEYDAVTAKLVSIEKFTPEMETEVTKCMSDLGVKKKTITFDRQIIRKAMGFSAGHWFKCPNGHFYTIGECGGAMELSRCPDCKATIGGQSHRLTAGNNLASEMDGATAPAWPTALQ